MDGQTQAFVTKLGRKANTPHPFDLKPIAIGRGQTHQRPPHVANIPVVCTRSNTLCTPAHHARLQALAQGEASGV